MPDERPRAAGAGLTTIEFTSIHVLMRHGVLLLAVLPGALVAQGRRPTPSPAPAPAAAAESSAVVLARGLRARAIGPAIMGGRVSDIALDPKAPATFYVGLGTGGVMKTTDNGATFSAVFEAQPVAAIGAVAVAPSDPSVVWVGTGEANDRNSTSWGDGVYRSTDGGGTWTNVGLKNSRTIARVFVHPTDPKTAYVAAMGDLWGWSAERGCYRTTDAGATWTRILAAPAPYADRVGCGDIAIDPSNPQVIYAALYARRRLPWIFEYGPGATDGKDVGGIFKSTDGGATWKRLGGRLPTLTGRIGLSVYAKDPRVVYAVVQSDLGGTQNIDQVRSRSGGVFRSGDGGETWTRTSPLDPRPFYFSQIRVDPTDDQRVYVLGYALHVSEDGGKSFREDRFKSVHPDNHALAIDPRTPERLLLGNDGGAYQSWNRGETWEHMNRFAAGEFYRLNADLQTPYRVCGGLQDNLNWVGPSRTRTKDGIVNTDWTNIEGGDGFYCVFDPDSANLIYAESQSGFVHRMNLGNGDVRVLRPEPTEGQPAFRFHWNSPLVASRHAKGTMFLGGNRVFALTNHGEEWRAISPDLSTQNAQRILATGSGAETYGVVYALAESPAKAGVLWAGTDDGKLWLTEDGGANWTDLTGSLPPAVKGQWIGRVEPSWKDARAAYLAVDAHRAQNLAPLLFRTTDAGRTWTSVAANLPANGPVKSIREDPTNPDLLYAGTEFGLFASLDRGRSWAPLGKLPTVAVDDIMVHPRDDDLLIATHGRSLYILDDVSPLQQLTAEVRAKPLHLFPPRAAEGWVPLSGSNAWTGTAAYRGENPPPGATLTFYVQRITGEPARIAITTPGGQPVANLTANPVPGINRVTWDLMPSGETLTEYGGEGRRFVRSGDYVVTVSYAGAKETRTLKVAIAPGLETR